MPNTPAIVNQGCSVFVRGTQATQSDADITHSLLQSIGTSEEITEDQMDAVTALSGSGPAYVFVMIEALADGGVKMGNFYYCIQSNQCDHRSNNTVRIILQKLLFDAAGNKAF